MLSGKVFPYNFCDGGLAMCGSDETEPTMTPLEQVEALYEALVAHYGEGEKREIRAAAKLLLVALDRMRQHGGVDWRQLVMEYVDAASDDPDKFDRIIAKSRTPPLPRLN
jgi:hypothetical protein